INIWSHLVPAICLVVFYVLPELFSATPRLPVLVLYAGVGSLLFASSLAHLLSENSAADSSLVLHTNAFNWLMISGIFMGAKVPERFAPGLFDIFGYGHQMVKNRRMSTVHLFSQSSGGLTTILLNKLFHLCVNMVAWNLCDAAHLDCAPIAWNSPSNVAISAAFLLSAVFTGCTVKTLSKKAQSIKYD
ncbi:hypothetical protein TELCIR_07294, partial [Teladorsagia circumcincta]